MSALLVGLLFAPAAVGGAGGRAAVGANLPRTADGKPDLGGIWQVRNTAASDLLAHAARLHMPAGHAVVADNDIPYQPWAAAKRIENFQNRATADPLAQCFMPGVPRIMYLDFPFQIFQTPQMIAMTFEWSSVHRQIYTDGSSHVDGIDFWMGDSRGRWDGDTLVVNVSNHNDKTWFDMAGNFHSEALKLVERYTLVDADTIQYEVTVEDPKVFTQAVEDQHAVPPAQGDGPDSRVPVPVRGRRSQRRVPARAGHLVSRARGARRHPLPPAR